MYIRFKLYNVLYNSANWGISSNSFTRSLGNIISITKGEFIDSELKNTSDSIITYDCRCLKIENIYRLNNSPNIHWYDSNIEEIKQLVPSYKLNYVTIDSKNSSINISCDLTNAHIGRCWTSDTADGYVEITNIETSDKYDTYIASDKDGKLCSWVNAFTVV